MIFVIVGSSRDRLTELTKVFLSIFPGSTIYQHIDPLRISKDVFYNKVSGVFLEAKVGGCNGIELIWKLRKQKRDLPVYILSENEGFRTAAIAAGADGYFVYPLVEETIKNELVNK